MTLILSICGQESIWMLADRRLTYKNKVISDVARKIMFLETSNDVAILGYAGLGATSKGTEPSDWMSAVLRGRQLTFMQSLDVLANAIQKEIPKHIPVNEFNNGFFHSVVINSFTQDVPNHFSICLLPDQKLKKYNSSIKRYGKEFSGRFKPTPIVIAGSGALILTKDKNWMRTLLDIVRAYDQCRISENVVANYLAEINFRVYKGVCDNTVGPKCIVAWRNRRNGIYNGGGKHLCFTELVCDKDVPSLPTIGNGMDISAISKIFMKNTLSLLHGLLKGNQIDDIDREKINRDLSNLPDNPDEDLQ